MLTIDKAIAELQKAKKAIGGDKVLILSLTASGLEMSDQLTVKVIDDKDSKYVEVRARGYAGIGEHVVYQD